MGPANFIPWKWRDRLRDETSEICQNSKGYDLLRITTSLIGNIGCTSNFRNKGWYAIIDDNRSFVELSPLRTANCSRSVSSPLQQVMKSPCFPVLDRSTPSLTVNVHRALTPPFPHWCPLSATTTRSRQTYERRNAIVAHGSGHRIYKFGLSKREAFQFVVGGQTKATYNAILR